MIKSELTLKTSEIIGVEASDLQNDDFLIAFSYWEMLRGTRLAPTWSEFELLKFPTNLIPGALVMNIKTNPLDFQYRFWGTRFTGVHDQDLTNKSVKTVEPKELGILFYDQNQMTYEAQKVCLFINRIPAAAGVRGFSTNETILRMPLSDDGHAITHIVAVVDFGEHVDAYMSYLEDNK